MGVPAIAISSVSRNFAYGDFKHAAVAARQLSEIVLKHGLPADTFINVNVPDSVPQGMRLTRQGKRTYEDIVVQNRDPRGRTYYWIGAGELGSRPDPSRR